MKKNINILTSLKIITFGMFISNVYSETPDVLIPYADTHVAPIIIEDDSVFFVDLDGNLKSVSDIKINEKLKRTVEKNSKRLKVKEEYTKDYYAILRSNKDEKTHYFISDDANGLEVSTINAAPIDTNPKSRLKLMPIDLILRHQKNKDYSFPLGKEKINVVEVTYDVYRKNITTTRKNPEPYNIFFETGLKYELLKKINSGQDFINYGPFTPHENEWISEKFYTISYEDKLFVNIKPKANKGFVSIKNIKYTTLKNQNDINLYTLGDLKNFNVFTGYKKRLKKTLKSGEVSIKSLESVKTQDIFIRGAVPQNAYNIKVKMTFKGGEVRINRKRSENYKISEVTDGEGYKTLICTYIDGVTYPAGDTMVTIKLNPSEEIKIKDFSITASKL